MPTDRLTVARANDLKSELVSQVQQQTRVVIRDELRRLANRAPGLVQADLDVIDAALEELAHSLFIARLRSARPDAVPLLQRLFDSTEAIS